MSAQHDAAFLRMFLLVLGALVAFTFVIMIAAGYIGESLDLSMADDPAHLAAIERRVAPVGRVRIAGEEEAAPVERQAPAAASAAGVSAVAAAPAADAGGTDGAHGEKIYQSACLACHMSGAAGAPILGDVAAWKPRLAQGEEALLKSVINGKGAMPAKGGRVDLSDDDIAAALEFLVSQSQ